MQLPDLDKARKRTREVVKIDHFKLPDKYKNLGSNKTYYGLYSQGVSLTYVANGGSSTPATQNGTRYANSYAISTYTNPTFTLASAITRTGHTFAGWTLNGSIYEFNQIKNIASINPEKLILPSSFYSDDTIETIAVIDAIINNKDYEDTLRKYILENIEYRPNFKPYFKTSFSSGTIKWAKVGMTA